MKAILNKFNNIRYFFIIILSLLSISIWYDPYLLERGLYGNSYAVYSYPYNVGVIEGSYDADNKVIYTNIEVFELEIGLSSDIILTEKYNTWIWIRILPKEKEIIQYDAIEVHFVYEGGQDTPNLWLRKKVNIPIKDKKGFSDKIIFPFSGKIYIYKIYFLGTSSLNLNKTRIEGLILYDENVTIYTDNIIETRNLEIVSPSEEFLKNVLTYPYWELLPYENRISLEYTKKTIYYALLFPLLISIIFYDGIKKRFYKNTNKNVGVV